jgi:hypothetical protein
MICDNTEIVSGRELLETNKERQLVYFGQKSYLLFSFKSHASSVGIAPGCGLDDRGSRFRFPKRAGNFSLHHRIQNGSGAHTASYPMGTRGYFPRGKAAGE